MSAATFETSPSAGPLSSHSADKSRHPSVKRLLLCAGALALIVAGSLYGHQWLAEHLTPGNAAMQGLVTCVAARMRRLSAATLRMAKRLRSSSSGRWPGTRRRL